MVRRGKPHNPEIFEKLLKNTHNMCPTCNSPAKIGDFALDHISPRSMRGTDDPKNLRLVCTRCNTSKAVSVRLPGKLKVKVEEWALMMGVPVNYTEIIHAALWRYTDEESIDMDPQKLKMLQKKAHHYDVLMSAQNGLQRVIDDLNALNTFSTRMRSDIQANIDGVTLDIEIKSRFTQ